MRGMMRGCRWRAETNSAASHHNRLSRFTSKVSLTKEVNALFVSNCGRLLFLPYSTAYTLCGIKRGKKTWETYP